MDTRKRKDGSEERGRGDQDMCRDEEMGANIVKIEGQVSEEGRNGTKGGKRGHAQG